LTASAQPPLRIVAFGDLDAGVWGAAIGAEEPLFVASVGGHQLSGVASMTSTDGDGEWRLTADGIELVVLPATERVLGAEGQALEGFDQLCRVHGRIATEPEGEVECLGRRAEREVADPRDLDSVRDVSAWFAVDDGLAMTALRRRKARGHDRDLTVAAILDAAGSPPVEEPRLSTTYDAVGAPVRMGLELWLPEHDGEQQYPRRMAGEAAGDAAGASGDAIELTTRPLRCHSRGNDGTGVYLLLRHP
jgi:hypothetical protein